MIRRCPAERWSTVVAALLDGVALVAATVPLRVRPGDARRLVARARERAAVLVAIGPWPVEASMRLYAEGGAWTGLGDGWGALDTASSTSASRRRAPPRGDVRTLAG